MTYTLTLAHLYPAEMNIYGDRGNVIALRQRCAWRGIVLRVLPVEAGAAVDWPEVDLAFFGGGQDSGQALIADDFLRRQGEGLARAVEDGMALLAICGGYQLLGHYFLTHSGERLPGVGVLDVHTVGGKQRLIGNIVVELRATSDERRVAHDDGRWTMDDGRWTMDVGEQGGDTRHPSRVTHHASRLVGFENHSGRTYHGPRVRALGRVLAGYGDNGEDGAGGAVYRNAIGCYLHGSLLPKNPQLADHLLRTALQRRYGESAELEPLDDAVELRAQRTMVRRLV